MQCAVKPASNASAALRVNNVIPQPHFSRSLAPSMSRVCVLSAEALQCTEVVRSRAASMMYVQFAWHVVTESDGKIRLDQLHVSASSSHLHLLAQRSHHPGSLQTWDPQLSK